MHDDRVTQQDLRNRFGLKRVSVYIGHRSIAVRGPTGQTADDRVEKHLLFPWLPRESMPRSCKRTPSLNPNP